MNPRSALAVNGSRCSATELPADQLAPVNGFGYPAHACLRLGGRVVFVSDNQHLVCIIRYVALGGFEPPHPAFETGDSAIGL